MSKILNCGDIAYIDFDPQAGKEQAGIRPCLVLTPEAVNRLTGLAIVCPITSKKKGYAFEVDVRGAKKITGVILVNQVTTVDWRARDAKLKDSVSSDCLEEVRHMLQEIMQL